MACEVLACDRLRVACALAVALAAALSLTACGRKGPLDPPPSAAIPAAPAATPAPAQFIDPMTPTGSAQPQARAAQAVPASQPPLKSFILDPLIQ